MRYPETVKPQESVFRILAVSVSDFVREILVIVSARSTRRVFGSADRSGADRTLDRAGAARGLTCRRGKRQRTVSRVASVKRRRRGRALPSAPPPGPESRSEWDQSPRLFRSAARP